MSIKYEKYIDRKIIESSGKGYSLLSALLKINRLNQFELNEINFGMSTSGAMLKERIEYILDLMN